MAISSQAVAVPEYGLYVGGAWQAAGDVYERNNPARPHELVGRFAIAGRAHVDAAYAAARAAARGWAGTAAIERGQVLEGAAALLETRAEEIAQALTAEEGKAIRDARAEVHRGVAILRYFAAECLQPEGEVYASATPDTLLFTVREPLGVVTAITPWNFPVAIPLWKIAPALAFGNAVVWKPAEIAPLCAVKLTEVLAEAGLPPGVLNLLTGPASGGLGDALTSHAAVDAITFTGSNRIGAAIRRQAAERGAKVQLELGGKNPVVVLPDANLERAADLAVRGAMLSTGQRCTSTSRAILVDDCADSFIAEVVKRVNALRVGDPADEQTDVGPLASAAQYKMVSDYFAIAREEGYQPACGGTAADPSGGYFVEPTVYLDVAPGSRIWREEIFGPVLALTYARDFDEAIALANDSEFGLSASVFTRDLRTALQFARRIEAGVVHINGETAGAEPHVPFGGMKASSSHSREQGKAARDFFTDIKTIYAEAR